MQNRWIVVLIGMLAVAVTLGTLGGIYLVNDDSSSESTESVTTTAAAELCEEARAVVDTSNEEISTINEDSEVQDTTFFAAVLAQQRAITFAMEAEPTCFTLLERSAAEGLLDALRGLMNTSFTAPAAATTQE